MIIKLKRYFNKKKKQSKQKIRHYHKGVNDQKEISQEEIKEILIAHKTDLKNQQTYYEYKIKEQKEEYENKLKNKNKENLELKNKLADEKIKCKKLEDTVYEFEDNLSVFKQQVADLRQNRSVALLGIIKELKTDRALFENIDKETLQIEKTIPKVKNKINKILVS